MTDPTPEFTHDCEECLFLGTIRRSEMILVTDEVSAALTAHIEGEASIADLNKALGVKPPEVWDLYYCAKSASSPLGGSAIARASDHGPDYKSVPLFYASKDPELSVVFDIVRRMKLGPFAHKATEA